MVWTYHDVQELKQKKQSGEQIQVSEVRALEKYIERKKEVAHLGEKWSQKQLLRAEELLQEIKKNRKEIEVTQ